MTDHLSKVNLEWIEAHRELFSLLSTWSDFPEEEIQVENQEIPEFNEKAQLENILEVLEKNNLNQLQQKYVDLFELNRRITLYMTYYKFEDSRERGTILAKLKMLYEMFGVAIDEAELTDYLPAMLEFLAVADFTEADEEALEDLKLIFSVLENGTYELLEAAKEKEQDPYVQLVRLIRNLLRNCLIIETEEVHV